MDETTNKKAHRVTLKRSKTGIFAIPNSEVFKEPTNETTNKKVCLENVNETFKIPIFYNEQVKKLNDTIIDNLELVKTIDKNETTPIYENVFKPSNKCSAKVLQQFASYYTTDIDYLKHTQKLIHSFSPQQFNTLNNKHNFSHFELDNVVSLWEEIKGETGFCEKYYYIDWSFAKELNNNPFFLQGMSLYNIASPILSLCLPIFILIVPFFIIKLKGIELNIHQYIDILKMLISDHAIFKVFTQFHEVSTNQKIYLLLSSAFYLFSIYQNILVCIRFYSNIQKIHNYLAKFKQYLAYTLDSIDYMSSKMDELTKYSHFKEELQKNKLVLGKLYVEINKITPYCFSFAKIGEIGHLMCTFYQIYNNQHYTDALLYSFGYNGYMCLLNQSSVFAEENKLTKTRFTNKRIKPVFKNMYYPKFMNDDPTNIIKNNCDLNKNMIISGPNASGKTTTLKTVLINIILSQQIGYGCFESLKLYPYDYLHCYINIPDTSGRDSLFQAEARRCKEIIDLIDEEKDKTHFCIFDELYSGTNPDEAVVSAYAFINYITHSNNVTFLLTTHYIKLCKKLTKNKKIQNYNMKTFQEGDDFKYCYLLNKGITKVKGGLKVLKDMNYPSTFFHL
jgi:hypothetical protein